MFKRIKRRTVILVLLGVFALLTMDAFLRVSDFKNTLLREYLSHEEFLKNLRMAKTFRREIPSEDEVERIFLNVGIEPSKVERTGVGVRIVADEVEWFKIPKLVVDLEERFEIESFKAQDNTGKGIFELEVIVK